MIRLDGHKFSTFAAPFRKPFDELLHRVMVATTADLVAKYHATTGYTQSDEITLVFPAVNALEGTISYQMKEGLKQELPVTEEGEGETKQEESQEKVKKNEKLSLMHAGRVLKISTLASAYCTARFNYHCLRLADLWPKEHIIDDPNVKKRSYGYERVQNSLRNAQGYFDARTFNVDNDEEVRNNIMWRSTYDCERNSRNNLGHIYFSTKEMHGLKAREVVEALKEKKNVDWNDWPLAFRYGTFVKKIIVNKMGHNPQTNQDELVERRELKAYAIHFKGFQEEHTKLLLCKHWNEVPQELLADVEEVQI
jgi:tRNA(His) guanylyltransferase